MNIETNSDYPKLPSVQGSDNTSDSADIQVLATESSTDAQASEFGTMMRKILGTADGSQVNEEELFASLIENRLSKHSEEAATFYRQQKEGFLNTLRRADGYVSVEDAALKALKATVDAGKVDSATAEKVNSEAFKAAQLDDNADALYDGRGSAGDPTIAVSDLESALFSMRAVIEKIDVGDLESGSRSLESAPTSSAPTANGPSSTGNAQDGSGGFLWKPVSESDGKLVVLLPTELKGLIDRVEIHSSLPPSTETLLGQGRFSGDQHNGGRAHFRFDKTGSEYGNNVNVVVFKDNGETVTYAVDNGSERHD